MSVQKLTSWVFVRVLEMCPFPGCKSGEFVDCRQNTTFFGGRGQAAECGLADPGIHLCDFLDDLWLDAGSRRFVGRFKTLCRPVPTRIQIFPTSPRCSFI